MMSTDAITPQRRIELVCAVSNEGRLLGTLPVRKLFGFPGSKK